MVGLTANRCFLQIILHSMHRYHPRFHLVQADDLFSVRWSVFQTFTFPETSFTAVTAYQNTKVSAGAARQAHFLSPLH